MANILLLEPDHVLARTYAAALRHVGHTVQACRTGQAAIETLEEFPAGLLILELQLAGHSGLELLHELRSYPEWQGLPVVINTHLTPQALTAARPVLERDAGVAVCLYKPRTSLQRLIRTVNEVLAEAGERL